MNTDEIFPGGFAATWTSMILECAGGKILCAEKQSDAAEMSENARKKTEECAQS